MKSSGCIWMSPGMASQGITLTSTWKSISNPSPAAQVLRVVKEVRCFSSSRTVQSCEDFINIFFNFSSSKSACNSAGPVARRDGENGVDNIVGSGIHCKVSVNATETSGRDPHGHWDPATAHPVRQGAVSYTFRTNPQCS